MTPSVTAVVLTMGNRPDQLERCLASLRDQDHPVSVTLVMNGGGPPITPSSVDRVVDLTENLGIPEGRNRGVSASESSLLAFIDDDAWLPETDIISKAVALFESHPEVGIVGLRVVDPETGISSRRWLPRLRKSNIAPGPVATFPGGGGLIRRAVFDAIGGFAGEFFYSGEETDFSMRAIDAGWTVWFEPTLILSHRASSALANPESCRLTMRNRVLIARRLLPVALWPTYVLGGLLRMMAHRCFGAALGGVWDGSRIRGVDRRTIAWSSVFRLMKLGRPPIL